MYIHGQLWSETQMLIQLEYIYTIMAKHGKLKLINRAIIIMHLTIQI